MKIIRLMFMILIGMIIGWGMSAARPAQAFDHRHTALNSLLKKHVVWINNGKDSRVRYADFAEDRSALRAYLESLSEVTKNDFDTWTKSQQLAFLINAYNAFTIELVLTEYPDVRSIKELGTFFQTPWKRKFFSLFGDRTHLDHIEHGLIRMAGVYDEPHIHFSLVCASRSCPPLRNEAFFSDTLEDQMADNLARFLSDRNKNRYDASEDVLEVSSLFNWYREDFSKGYRGYTTLKDFFSRHAELMTNTSENRIHVEIKRFGMKYLPYDWSLNDLKTEPSP